MGLKCNYMEEITLGKISDFLTQCKSELDGWFGIDLPMPELMIMQSLQDVADIWDREPNEDLPTAWADTTNHRIYMLRLDEVAKLRKKMPYDFLTLLKHEYAHLYWYALVKSNIPMWMDEGLACYLAGQVLKLSDENVILKLENYFDQKNFDTYAVGYMGVKYLIDKFGKDKFIQFLKKLPHHISEITKKMPPEEFEKLFEDHFGFKLTNWFNQG